ncbi:MAG: hypothetical protein ACRDFA_01120 [bacterium]
MPAPSRGRRRSGGYLWIGAGAVALALFVGLLVTAAIRAPLPRIGDHWHAKYSIVVCGRAESPLPFTSGNVHTHGDGLIHIHPEVPSEAGNNANLRRFFSGAGMTFTASAIEFPDGRAYRNGDRCPDGAAGRVRLIVNGRASDAYDRYVPRNGDLILIQFM